MDKQLELSEALKQLLSEGIIHFAYRKKTGELRIAKGTTQLEIIPEDSRPKGTGTEKENTKAYWDLSVGGWRAYNPLCVVWVETVGQMALTNEELKQLNDYVENINYGEA